MHFTAVAIWRVWERHRMRHWQELVMRHLRIRESRHFPCRQPCQVWDSLYFPAAAICRRFISSREASWPAFPRGCLMGRIPWKRSHLTRTVLLIMWVRVRLSIWKHWSLLIWVIVRSCRKLETMHLIHVWSWKSLLFRKMWKRLEDTVSIIAET